MLERKIGLSQYLFFMLLIAVFFGPQLLGRALQNVGMVAWANMLIDWPKETHVRQAERTQSLLNQSLTFCSDRRSIRQSLADVLLVQGQEDEAIAAWQQVKGGADILLQRGIRAQDVEQYGHALIWFEFATRTDPESIQIWSHKILAHIDLRQWEQARESLYLAEKSVQGSDTVSSAYLELGRMWQLRMDPPGMADALNLYESALAADRFTDSAERLQTHYHSGEILQRQGRFDEAILALTMVVTAQPDHYWGHVRLGRVLWLANDGQDNVDKAEEHLKKAIAINSNSKWAFRWLGVIYQNTEHLDQATQMYRRVLEIDPKDNVALKFFSEGY